MVPFFKLFSDKLKNLENKKYFSNPSYFGNRTFYISPDTSTYTYLIWISSSGGNAEPSLILITNNSGQNKLFVANFGGTIFEKAELENGKIKITATNAYGNYGYIKVH